MTHVYSLVCYRPSGDDHCKGCLMSSSDSDFEIEISTDPDVIAEKWADKWREDESREKYTAVQVWEITLLVNGHDKYTDQTEYTDNSPFDMVQIKADVALGRKRGEVKQALEKMECKAARVAKMKATLAEKAKEKADLAEFKRLSLKFRK